MAELHDPDRTLAIDDGPFCSSRHPLWLRLAQAAVAHGASTAQADAGDGQITEERLESV